MSEIVSCTEQYAVLIPKLAGQNDGIVLSAYLNM